MKPQLQQEDGEWAWLDVYTRMKSQKDTEWAFRKRVARKAGETFEEMRSGIARMLGSSPAVPMSFKDFKLVKRP